jgi:hypothetical protein
MTNEGFRKRTMEKDRGWVKRRLKDVAKDEGLTKDSSSKQPLVASSAIPGETQPALEVSSSEDGNTAPAGGLKLDSA